MRFLDTNQHPASREAILMIPDIALLIRTMVALRRVHLDGGRVDRRPPSRNFPPFANRRRIEAGRPALSAVKGDPTHVGTFWVPSCLIYARLLR
jgi:hypothetical protein